MAEALTAARWQRCTVCASITKFEARTTWWEGIAELAACDHCAIQCCVETLKEYNPDFNSDHFIFVELANDEELEAEQVILDNHTDRVTDFLDRLLWLLPEPRKVSKKSPATVVAEGLLKRLCYVIYELTSLNDTVCRQFDHPRSWYGHLSSRTVVKASIYHTISCHWTLERMHLWRKDRRLRKYSSR